MATITNQNSLDLVLDSILEERRRKKKLETSSEYTGFVCVPNIFWTRLFSVHFMEGQDDLRDDLLFFVRHGKSKNSKVQPEKTEIAVFRKHSKRLPSLTDTSIRWDETVYLNIILQQFIYTLTCAVCTRTGLQELQVLKKQSLNVYASPSRRKMDSKGDEEEISYPNIYFMVDNFDEVFHDISVRDSEMVCVELVASDKNSTYSGVIFLGSIRYDALKRVYEVKSRAASRMAQRMSFGFYKGLQRLEFVRMRGPYGKGHAEVAVSRVATDRSVSAPVTPCMTPTEHDLSPTDPHHYLLQYNYTDLQQQTNTYSEGTGSRRMSDPSGGIDILKNFGKHSSMKRGMMSASKESGLNGEVTSCDGDNEVEAADIREELSAEPDSMYNRMFGRGFGQAWHWLKERRRANSVALNAYLTYITVPWHTIIEDVLEGSERPILTY